MHKKHILICGERGIGKTTLVERLVSSCTRPVYGFCTKAVPRPEGGFFFYIHPAGSTEKNCTETNLIAQGDGKGRNVHGTVFSTLGLRYLQAKSGGILVMDELGFMETESKVFCEAVKTCLDGDIPVLAVVKARFDVEFLHQIRNHPKVRVYYMTRENREELFLQIKTIIEQWNKEQ